MRADLGDVRVFNAAGEVVPHAFRPRVTTSRRAAAGGGWRSSRFTPTRRRASTASSCGSRNAGDRTVVNLRTPRRQARARDEARGLRRRRARPRHAVRAVALELPAERRPVVMTRDDRGERRFAALDTLASGAPRRQARAGGERLEQLRIEFPARKAKYLRLIVAGGAARARACRSRGRARGDDRRSAAPVEPGARHRGERQAGRVRVRPRRRSFRSTGCASPCRSRIPWP